VAAKITDEIVRKIAIKIAKDLIDCSSEMSNCMLKDVVDAMERGEDVDDGLANMILTRPFMERFINELLKYEEE
jgi:hypothetical protein